jgi:hypothetical protein
VRPSFCLSGGSSFSCSAEMQQALIFWPLHPLVQHAGAMLRPMRLYAIEDGRYGFLDLRKEGSRRYSCRYPIAAEVWTSWWWNDRGHIGSGCGSRAPVHYARSRLSHRWEWVPRLGAPVVPHLARGLHMSLGRGGSTPRGSSALMTLWGSGEVETAARGAYLTRDRSVRLGWDGG